MQGDVLTNKFSCSRAARRTSSSSRRSRPAACTVAQVAAQAADGSMAPYNFGQPIPPGRKDRDHGDAAHAEQARATRRAASTSSRTIRAGRRQLGLEADVDPFFQVNPQT
jgi:hypothetical protein